MVKHSFEEARKMGGGNDGKENRKEALKEIVVAEDVWERLAERLARAIGSVPSLLLHSIFFIGIFSLSFFGFTFDQILLILTTIVSLEAIYLAIFIQMTVNRQARELEEVQEDIEDIQEDVEDISEDIEDIQENVEDIGEDVEGIQKEVEEIGDDVEDIQKDVDDIQEDVEDISEDKDHSVSNEPVHDRGSVDMEGRGLERAEALLRELAREIEDLRKGV